MKVVRHLGRIADRDRVRQHAVEPAPDPVQRNRSLGAKARDLPARVHARVGATGALGYDAPATAAPVQSDLQIAVMQPRVSNKPPPGIEYRSIGPGGFVRQGPGDTQAPIPVGETFTYQVHCPDEGAYWYHPHIREDYGQEMGLYGNIVVAPADPNYWPPAHRELALVLDDVLIEDGRIAPFSRTEPTYVAMGRFGNVLLLNGEPDLSLGAKQGEVVRLYLTNTANTRTFKVALPGAQLKLVGGDSGHVEREAAIDALGQARPGPD